MQNKENSGLPSSARKTTVNYRSMPTWCANAAIASCLLFAGLYSYIAVLPAVRPAIISPTDFGASSRPDHPMDYVDGYIDSTSIWLQEHLRPQMQLASEGNIGPNMSGGIVDATTFPSILTRPNLTSETYSRIQGLYSEEQFENAQEHQYVKSANFAVFEILLLLMSAVSLILALRFKENKMQLGSDGLTFPSGMLPDLNWKRKRTWNDLSAISITGGGKSNEPQKVHLYFTSGGEAALMVDRFSKKELELFFLSLDDFAPHAARSPEMVAFRHELFSSLKKDDPSFTQLWEEELSSHFAATNFVALTPGAKLQNGKLKLIMHMSSGGLSAVYLADSAKGMVVIKESVVPAGSSAANQEKARDMFKREASMLMKLSHPQIAKVMDHFQENDRDYLLLEYVPGVTLREYVRRHGPQSEERVSSWAAQIAGILAYLHGQDPPIIHRDLTPDNLMITPSGEIVLIDFGAANQFLGTATGTIVGKQFYISPEQFRGKAEPASDIYSLGGTLHYLLTGKEPEALSTSHPKQLRPSISDPMDQLVAACTILTPDKRIASAAEFLMQLGGKDESASNPAKVSTAAGTSTNESATVDSTDSAGTKESVDLGTVISVRKGEKQLR